MNLLPVQSKHPEEELDLLSLRDVKAAGNENEAQAQHWWWRSADPSGISIPEHFSLLHLPKGLQPAPNLPVHTHHFQTCSGHPDLPIQSWKIFVCWEPGLAQGL